jgi:hypothetical protein
MSFEFNQSKKLSFYMTYVIKLWIYLSNFKKNIDLFHIYFLYNMSKTPLFAYQGCLKPNRFVYFILY